MEALLRKNGMRAEAMEGFFSDVGHALSGAAKAVAPVVTKALPGAISGAATGCALGPWGCLGGAVIGGVGSALASGGGQRSGARSPAAGPSGVARISHGIAGAVGGGGISAGAIGGALPLIAGLAGDAGGAAGGDRTNPAGVLLGLLHRPELLQALGAMALGSAGRTDIPVGGTPIPASAFANLLSVLGSKAFAKAESIAEPSEDLPEYLYTNGTLAVDPTVPSDRAGQLLKMLGEASVEMPPAYGTEFTESDEDYDALDIAELELLEAEGYDVELDD
jgi:hypothetical protein